MYYFHFIWLGGNLWPVLVYFLPESGNGNSWNNFGNQILKMTELLSIWVPE
jgi:hypothetical protein